MARSHQGSTRLGPSLRADARASAAREAVVRHAARDAAARAAAIAALALAACGAPTPPPEPPPPPKVAPAPPAPLAATPAPEAAGAPIDRYKRTVAEHILKRNAAQTFAGVPPHFLRAVIVLQITVDARGTLTEVRTLRSRSPEHTAAAVKSVRASGPLPAPPRELLRGGRLEFSETWLFRDDGRFQVRSLAEPQGSTVARP